MLSKESKRNIGCGAFVLIAIVLGVVVVVMLSNYFENLKKKTPYKVRFPLTTGAAGLKPGSLVRVGGKDAGRVEAVRYDPETGAPEFVVVDIVVDQKITLYKDAEIILERQLLGSMSTLNVPNAGHADKGQLLADGELMGTDSPMIASLLKQAGIERKDVTEIIEDVKATTKKVRSLAEERLPAILTKVDETAGNASALTGDLREGVKGWVPKIDATLTNVQGASGDLRARLEEARELLAGVQGIITANRPRIDAIMENLQETMARVRGDVVPQVTEILRKGDRAALAAADALEDVRDLIREEEPNIRLTLANLRLAGDQLKLAITEIKRNPWRLLYQPGTKELERELLYEAARTYASSVSDLRAATATLQQVSTAAQAGGPGAPDAGKVNELIAQMQASYARYKQAEDAFLQKLLASPGGQ